MERKPDSLAQERDCPPPQHCKPVMGGYLKKSIQFNIAIAIGIGALTGVAYHFLVQVPYRKKVEDFYKNYDAEEVYKQMRKKKLFQSG